METNDKIKALKEQALDWIEKQLSSYDPELVPEGIEDVLLEENWDYLKIFYLAALRGITPEPLADIVRKILNEVRLQEFRKKRGKQ